MYRLLVSFYDWLIANPEVLGEGPGLFSTLHICLMIFLTAWLVGMFFLFRRFSKFAKYAILGMCVYILVVRIFRMILCVATGINTWVEVLPFHLCHIMSFVLPICVFFNWKKPLPAFLLYAFFGGVLTFIFGDYYKYDMLTFMDIESIILHTLLPTVAVAFVAIKQVKITVLDMIIIPIMLVCLAGWAWIGNILVPGANFMYIKESGLPFNLFPGHNFLWTYIIIMIIALASIYIPAIIINRRGKVKLKIGKGVAGENAFKEGLEVKEDEKQKTEKYKAKEVVKSPIKNRKLKNKKTVLKTKESKCGKKK